MYYVILDSNANLVDSYDREDEAREALKKIVQRDPDSADEYAVLTYDDDGVPTSDAVTEGSELVEHTIPFG
jgi:hypothetical protein